jgi:hypothetical protein
MPIGLPLVRIVPFRRLSPRPPLNLARFKYRNIEKRCGGPIDKVEISRFCISGEELYLANCFVASGLVSSPGFEIFSNASGSGVARSPQEARHIAISEALERWAFQSIIQSPHRRKYGFELDPSSSGMAAFPGLTSRNAKRNAFVEAVERYYLLAWWEGYLDGEIENTEWENIWSINILTPFGIHLVILFDNGENLVYSYGWAASDSRVKARYKARIELERHKIVMRSIGGMHRFSMIGSLLERRAYYFSTLEGHLHFQSRLKSKGKFQCISLEPMCNAEIHGPWSKYAVVWRFVFKPPSQRFVSADDRYFFW